VLRLLLASALLLAGSAAAVTAPRPAPAQHGLVAATAATAVEMGRDGPGAATAVASGSAAPDAATTPQPSTLTTGQPGSAPAGAATSGQPGRPAADAATIAQSRRAVAGAAMTAHPGQAAGAGSDMSYMAPIAGPLRVLRPFQPPPTPYSAGHRGVDLAAPLRAEVLAAGAGQVTFAGTIAGRGVVVIAHPDGIRTEYEPVRALVAVGQVVARRQPIGQVSGQHGAWPPGRCLHWGARRGEVYLDPLLLLRPLGPVRLLPWPR
jgi:murein DD-endopeptidase MepM/ murein hydrolase activator NlpD